MKWGVLFGAVAAVAAVVALWPAFHPAAGADKGGTSGAVTSTSDTSSSGGAATTTSAADGARRALATLPLARGGGAVRRDGDDLVMDCGTNQSGDTYREVEYTVPATTTPTRFQATLHASNDGGADQRIGLQFFVRDQYARADQTVQQAVRTLTPGGTGSLDATIPAGTGAIVLRLTCYLPGSSMRIQGATLLTG